MKWGTIQSCSILPLDLSVREELLEAEPVEGYFQALLHILHHERKLLEATGVGGTPDASPVSRFSIN